MRAADGVRRKPSDFGYVWTHNYNTVSESSGYGKNSFIFRNNYLNDGEHISVTASSMKGNYRASKNIQLNPISPKIILYETTGQKGTLYERAIDVNNYFLIGGEGTSIVAEPYYFSPKNALSRELAYTWTVNDQRIIPPGPKNILSVRPETDGIAEVRVIIESASRLFQSASSQLLINLQTNE